MSELGTKQRARIVEAVRSVDGYIEHEITGDELKVVVKDPSGNPAHGLRELVDRRTLDFVTAVSRDEYQVQQYLIL